MTSARSWWSGPPAGRSTAPPPRSRRFIPEMSSMEASTANTISVRSSSALTATRWARCATMPTATGSTRSTHCRIRAAISPASGRFTSSIRSLSIPIRCMKGPRSRRLPPRSLPVARSSFGGLTARCWGSPSRHPRTTAARKSWNPVASCWCATAPTLPPSPPASSPPNCLNGAARFLPLPPTMPGPPQSSPRCRRNSIRCRPEPSAWRGFPLTTPSTTSRSPNRSPTTGSSASTGSAPRACRGATR